MIWPFFKFFLWKKETNAHTQHEKVDPKKEEFKKKKQKRKNVSFQGWSSMLSQRLTKLNPLQLKFSIWTSIRALVFVAQVPQFTLSRQFYRKSQLLTADIRNRVIYPTAAPSLRNNLLRKFSSKLIPQRDWFCLMIIINFRSERNVETSPPERSFESGFNRRIYYRKRWCSSGTKH